MVYSSGSYLDPFGGGSRFDELSCFLRMRHVGHVAGLYLDRLCLSALGHHAFLVRIDRSVFAGHHVPGGLVLPRGVLYLMCERVGGDRHLRYCHELSFIPWNVRCGVGDEVGLVDPPKSIAVRFKRLRCLRQRRFDRRTTLAFIESKCSNIDQCCNVWMISGLGDDGPA